MPRETGKPNSWKLMETILAARPDLPEPRRASERRVAATPHCPSPNLSSKIATSAAIASDSSTPSVSISTSLPMPAASIITPMMLLALTRRPRRARKTSLLKLPASLLSLAEARACRPSLLLILIVALIIASGLARLVLRPRRRHLHDALRRTGHGAGERGIERFVLIAKRAPEHGHVDAGDDLDVNAVGQALGDVAGRRAEDVGEDQDIRRRQPREHLSALGLDLLDRPVGQDVERTELARALRKSMFG